MTCIIYNMDFQKCIIKEFLSSEGLRVIFFTLQKASDPAARIGTLVRFNTASKPTIRVSTGGQDEIVGQCAIFIRNNKVGEVKFETIERVSLKLKFT
ncbi:hypothetical protein AHF37_12448 [Paragonimus kellicotti]|nr:hypothetical protein AHF37_12448 [Paragonimus kellicotti]